MGAPIVSRVLAALAGPRPMPAVAGFLHGCLDVDRVSITAINGDAYQVLAHAGTDLLPTGARFAVDTSTHFLQAARGDGFRSPDFGAERVFVRPIDLLMLSSGFRSGYSVPMTVGGRVVGALSFSSLGYDWDPGRLRRVELEDAAAVLASYVDGAAWSGPVSVLIAHADPLVAAGIRDVLSREIPADVAVAGDAAALRDALAGGPPDVLVLGETLGLDPDVGAVIEARPGSVPTVYIAARDTAAARLAAAQVRAAAFLTHERAVAHLSNLVVTLARREPLPPSVRVTAPAGEPVVHLTRRETELLRGLETGRTLREIAHQLGVSETTLKGYARDLYGKLGAHSRGEVVHLARRRGLLP